MEKKKNVLFIAPSCYPVDGAEAIVNMKLLQALQKSGLFDIDVISKKRMYEIYPSAPIESYGIDKSKVHIVEVPNKINLRTIFETSMCFVKFGVTMKGAHWAYEALPVVDKLVREKKYDYVVTKNAPSYLLGYYLKKKYNLKWVASWNDPYPREKYPAPYGKGWNYSTWGIRRETTRMSCADIHLFPNERLKQWMLNYLNITDSVTRIIPHIMVPQESNRPPYGDVLKMIHSGNLQSPRNPENLFKGLARMIAETPDAKIELYILGMVDEGSLRLIKELHLEGIVRFLGKVSYQESLAMLSDYHIAVIVEANCKEGIFLPTKVGDFMSVSIPIFSVSPKVGILNDIYKSGHISYFADVDSVKEISEALKTIYNDYMHNDIRKTSVIEEYSSNFIVESYYNF